MILNQIKVQLRELIDTKKEINVVQKDQIREDQEHFQNAIASEQRQDEIRERKRQLRFKSTTVEVDTNECRVGRHQNTN